MEVHLFNVLCSEARASLEFHGKPICRHPECDDEATMCILIKPEDSTWGQQIEYTAACTAHRSILDDLLKVLPPILGAEIPGLN